MLVLARNKYIFNQLEDILNKEKTPFNYKMNSNAIKFESNLMKVFDLSLRTRLNKKDALHKNQLLKIEPCGDINSISALITNDSSKDLINLIINLREDGSDLIKTLEDFRDKLIVDDKNERSLISMILVNL